MKLTPGFDFINIYRADYLRKRRLCSFSLLTVWLCSFLAKEYYHKSNLENFGEIGLCGRFHQHLHLTFLGKLLLSFHGPKVFGKWH